MREEIKIIYIYKRNLAAKDANFKSELNELFQATIVPTG